MLTTKMCLDNNNIVHRVFLNLQQAFNTLDHERLRNKLKNRITKLEVKKNIGSNLSFPLEENIYH